MSDERDDDELEAERRKEEVGMAPAESAAYYRNAYYILSAYARPNAETRQKLRWLEENGYGSQDDDSD